MCPGKINGDESAPKTKMAVRGRRARGRRYGGAELQYADLGVIVEVGEDEGHSGEARRWLWPRELRRRCHGCALERGEESGRGEGERRRMAEASREGERGSALSPAHLPRRGGVLRPVEARSGHGHGDTGGRRQVGGGVGWAWLGPVAR